MIFSKKTKPRSDKNDADNAQGSGLEPKLDIEMSLPQQTEPETAKPLQNSVLKKASDSVKAPFVTINNRLRKKLRDTAIERARTRILIAGQSPDGLPLETLEIVVREEEDKLKNQIKEKGLLFVVASLGLGWWL